MVVHVSHCAKAGCNWLGDASVMTLTIAPPKGLSLLVIQGYAQCVGVFVCACVFVSVCLCVRVHLCERVFV